MDKSKKVESIDHAIRTITSAVAAYREVRIDSDGISFSLVS